MQTFKYFHARASGYSPALAVAFMRGASLPAKPASVYVEDINRQQRARLMRRALGRMVAPNRVGWRTAWMQVRRDVNPRFAEIPYDDPNMLPTYIHSTADFY